MQPFLFVASSLIALSYGQIYTNKILYNQVSSFKPSVYCAIDHATQFESKHHRLDNKLLSTYAIH